MRHQTESQESRIQSPECGSGERTPARLSWLLALGFCLLTCVLGSSCSTPASKSNGRRVEVDVSPGMGIRALADTLAAKQVIGSKPLFLFYSWYYNYGHRIRPNRYRMPVGTGARRALKLLSGEEPALGMVTIPEGYTMNQVAAALAERGICPADGFLSACLDTNLLREAGVPAATAEGYLFPETYEFLTGSQPSEVVRRMVRQFFSVLSELRTLTPDPRSLTPVTTESVVNRMQRPATIGAAAR